MINTVPPLKIVKDDDSVDLRAHYGLVAQQVMLLLWQRKRMIAATVVAALVIAVIALSLIEPRYTSEALIQVNLDLNPDRGVKSQATVSVDAAEVAGTTARIIRSRATADAVVARLGLDKDPRFESRPLFSRWRSGVSAALGLQRSALTPHDLAVDALMRQVRVTAEPRSYLISVAVTAADPERAAKLANAVTAEYLRTQKLKELAETRSAAEHELADASYVYGPRHPSYLRALAKVEQLEAQIRTIGDASTTEDLIKLAAGFSLIPAHKVMKPSGPNISVVLALAILAGLSLGICLARYTPVGLIPSALRTGVPIVAVAVSALLDRIFAIVGAGRAAGSSLIDRLPLLMAVCRLGVAAPQTASDNGATAGRLIRNFAAARWHHLAILRGFLDRLTRRAG